MFFEISLQSVVFAFDPLADEGQEGIPPFLSAIILLGNILADFPGHVPVEPDVGPRLFEGNVEPEKDSEGNNDIECPMVGRPSRVFQALPPILARTSLPRRLFALPNVGSFYAVGKQMVVAILHAASNKILYLCYFNN